MEIITADEVATCVLETFRKLPAKRKPLQRPDGSREWVPLSGIVLAKVGEPLFCASLGTGMKCLPASKLLQVQGMVLHDCHAEIIAMRAFNRFLVDECAILTQDDTARSRWMRRTTPEETTGSFQYLFALKEGISIYFYSSEAPCGDASMELTMLAQEDATPWDRTPSSTVPGPDSAVEELNGRGFFSELGVVRRKPARPDAPLSLSKSCTDKLAMYQCTSILNSPASLLISPTGAYIKMLILPFSQHVSTATERAFSPEGRMSTLTPDVTHSWENGLSFHPFNIATTTLEFEWSRRAGNLGNIMLPSNVTAVYTPHLQETLIGGVLQGRRQLDPKGASAICRKSLWSVVKVVVARMEMPTISEAVVAACYKDFKNCEELRYRRRVKEDVWKVALKGWVKNEGDDSFS